MSEASTKSVRQRPVRRRAFDVFTTGEVATICHVSARTASKWVDRGILDGYRLPGGQDRRVTRNALLEFMIRSGMPTQWLDQYESGSPAA